LELSTEKNGQSFSQCLGNSFRQTVAGIFADPRMTATVMQEGHLSATKARIQADEGEYILVAQDTTYYNYSGQQAMAGRGKIQGNIKGIMQHNLLALSETGMPLGLLGQEYWSRESSHPYQGERESEKWGKGLALVNRELGGTGKKVVLIQAREADIFAFFQAERAPGVELLVRVHEPRKMEVVHSGEVAKLAEMRGKLPIVGEQRVVITRQNKEITLVLALQGGAVNVRSGTGEQTQGLALVIAQEVASFDSQGKSVFDPEQRVIWYLLTSLPVTKVEEMERWTYFYALRWRIERLHYTLKSGALDVEKLQFDDLTTTLNALAFYSIVAWQILAIVYLTRHAQDAVATKCFTEQEIKVLEATSKKPLPTVKAATLALAKLVGFAPSKRQPLPGIKMLAMALERFHYLKLGFQANSS
jgi:hypothetical protein